MLGGSNSPEESEFFLLPRTIRKRLLTKLKEVKYQLRKRMHQPLAEVGKWSGVTHTTSNTSQMLLSDPKTSLINASVSQALEVTDELDVADANERQETKLADGNLCQKPPSRRQDQAVAGGAGGNGGDGMGGVCNSA